MACENPFTTLEEMLKAALGVSVTDPTITGFKAVITTGGATEIACDSLPDLMNAFDFDPTTGVVTINLITA